MRRTINYTEAPKDVEKSLEQPTIVSDFLPSPEELVSKGEKEKITMAVDKRSRDLYGQYAKKYNNK